MSRKRNKRAGESDALSLETFMETLAQDRRIGSELVHQETLDAQPASFGTLKPGFPGELRDALHKEGIQKLFSHQKASIDAVRKGKNLVAVTPTASGKTLVYLLPVLERALQHPDSRTLLLFPLKALAQDQLKHIKELLADFGDGKPRATVYDGDTSKNRRESIRKYPPNLLLTNPDMLHFGMLPYHAQWGDFFRNLEFVVIDELHTYKGIFGSHVLQILRRLRRVCSFYHSKPQFITTSATIGNPSELAEKLVGEKFTKVEKNGAPSAARHMFFVNPSGSLYTTATRLFLEAVSAGLKTIVFTKARRITELIHQWTVQSAPDLADRISAYRAGYLPSERREIENQLQSGELAGVISTSALEMGIDIGGLDVCILVGYPGTITSTWQRAGRVGRKQRDSAIFLLALPDALDQYFMRHPEDFFRRAAEAAVVDENNPYVLKNHLVCAAQEVPIRIDEKIYPPKKFKKLLKELVDEGEILEAAGGKTWFASRKQPHRRLDLRGAGPTYTILDERGRGLIGHVNGWQALAECHPGAIYLHHGGTYEVIKLDFGKSEVIARRGKFEYYTQARTEKETKILEVYNTRETDTFTVSLGKVEVTEWVAGYEKRSTRGRDKLSEHDLDLPPVVYETIGIWIQPTPEALPGLAELEFHPMGSIHAIEHASLALLPLFALCDRNDVGGISFTMHPQLKTAAVFLYDGHPGGVGLADRAYEVIDKLLKNVLDLLEACPCESGCPSCIHSPKCGHGNNPLDKNGAIRMLRHLTGEEVFLPVEGEDSAKIPRLDLPEKEEKQLEKPKKRSKKTVPKVPAPLLEKPFISLLPTVEGKDIVVFDLETQLSAEEVGGWHNAHLMRISLGVLYERKTGTYHTYLEDRVGDLINRLKKAEMVVGFNNKRFDNSVLSAYTGMDLRELRSLDLLEEIEIKHGFRLSLDRLSKATFNSRKSADGLMALQWWKEGKIEEIEKYCRMDVELTARLLDFALEKGYWLYERKGLGTVRLPIELPVKRFFRG